MVRASTMSVARSVNPGPLISSSYAPSARLGTSISRLPWPLMKPATLLTGTPLLSSVSSTWPDAGLPLLNSATEIDSVAFERRMLGATVR